MTQTIPTQSDKPKKLDKTAALMQLALELKLSRTDGGQPMGEIPNWKSDQLPTPLTSDHFKIWLAFRAFKVHGFVASSAALNGDSAVRERPRM